MSDTGAEPGRGPEDIFDNLRDRPAPELDSARLWRRIEARLTPRSASLWARLFGAPARPRPVLRLAWAVGALTVAAVALWAAMQVFQASAPQFVLLAPGEADSAPSAAVPEVGAELLLDVRLVRGYDGAVPADVRAAQALGVGGADALVDVRGRIETLLPFSEFGVVGAWRGPLAVGAALDVQLSDGYRLMARSTDVTQGLVRLVGIELAGSGGETVSGDLNLEPGKLYILGVPARGADDDLVLLLRARAGAEERR